MRRRRHVFTVPAVADAVSVQGATGILERAIFPNGDVERHAQGKDYTR